MRKVLFLLLCSQSCFTVERNEITTSLTPKPLLHNKDCSDALRERGLVRKLFDPMGKIEIIPRLLQIEVNQIQALYKYAPLLTCLKQDDPQLINYIRGEMLLHPSDKPINLSTPLHTFLETPISVPNEVDNFVFDRKLKGGFFIEAGANDFEDNSDSIHFEANHGWSGLLVEPNPFGFLKGQMKNRKAYSINTCLSPERRPTVIQFSLSSNSFNVTGSNEYEAPIQVICIPLYSILMALETTDINYFSLDVEGSEFPILKTIPWEKVNIQVLSIETHFAGELYPGTREDIIAYMDDVGYNHIPWGHKNDRKIMFTGYNNRIITITNDMFVKKGINVKTPEQLEENNHS